MSTAVFMNEAKAFDLTAVQFSALVVIREHPGIDATRVSDLIFFDRSTIGNVLDRLEKKGLILRRAGTADRRDQAALSDAAGSRHVAKDRREAAPDHGRHSGARPARQATRARFVKLLTRLVGADGRNGSTAKSG